MRFLKSFGAGLFSFVFGVLVICMILVFNVSGFATKENITKSMINTDLLTSIKKIRNSGSGEGSNGASQVIDEMYSLADQFSVSEDVVDSIINSNITKQIIGDAIGNLTDYVINGKETRMFSEDDIYELITDNLDDILKAANVSLDDGQKEKFLREIKKQLPDIVEVVPTSESLVNSEHNFEINLIQELFSTKVKVILCVLAIISALAVIILKKEDFEWCANLGVSLLIAGLVTMGISLLIPGLVIDMMGSVDLSLFSSSITEVLSKPILYSGAGILVLAILLFIFYKVMENRNYKKSKS